MKTDWQRTKERMKKDPAFREKYLKRLREKWHANKAFYRRNKVNKTKLKQENLSKELDKLLKKYA